ncbi:MAG: CotH kinase family protein [Pirellulaceae bacterium]
MAKRNRLRRQNKIRNKKFAGLEPLEDRRVLTANVIISEILASNDSIIDDDNGVSSDYIELYNSGSSDADLSGWHLTDDLSDKNKWTFPDGVSLAPGESLVIFASDSNQTDPAGTLHTNFRLTARGEYLGLYEADARTVVSELNEFPEQYTDISYGVNQTLSDRTFLSSGSGAKVLVPSDASQDAGWTATDYNDANWSNQAFGLGFDSVPEDGDFGPLVSASGSLASMQGQATSAYIRSEFEIAGDVLPTFEAMNLSMNYDDGFAAYLNGQLVASVNAPEQLAWNSAATGSHGGIETVLSYQDFSDADDRDDFTLKGNAAWNGNQLQLTSATADQNSAVWTTNAQSFGPDYTFSTSMAFDIHSPGGPFADADGIGGEGLTFVLQGTDNNVLGSGGGSLGLEGTGMTYLAIELDSVATGAFDPDDKLASHVGINTSTDGSIARVAIDRFNGNAFFPGDPGPGVNFIYLWADYSGEDNQLDVYVSNADGKPDEPTLSATVNLDELFGGTPSLFAGWTATTGASYNTHELLSYSMTTGVGELGREAVDFDLSAHVDKLQVGKNVLAIHALNVAADDEDLLIVPNLTAKQVSVGSDYNFFFTPTPGEINGEGTLAPSGGATFSVTQQLFVDPFTVEITPETPGATIRYTLDGSIPSETSELYTGPITVSETTRIRARAFEPDRAGGPISTVGYTQLASDLVNFDGQGMFESNLPIMVFDSFGNRRVNQSDRLFAATVASFINVGEDGTASLTDAAEFNGRAGMRIRGQSSQGWAKKQYAVELWAEGGDDSTNGEAAADSKDQAAEFFGLPAESDWVLNGPYSDKTQLNNFLTFQWYNELGLYAPRARLVEVFVNDRGDELDFQSDYRGTYVLLEKIKVDENRVDVEKIVPGDDTEPDISGGYIWKKDKDGFRDVNFRTSMQSLKMVSPDFGEVTDEQVDWLKNHIIEFETALNGPNFADPVEGYAKYIDVDSWVDTWIMVEFTKNIDGFRLSTYYHKDRGGKIKQGPAWDYNLSLANGNYLKGSYPEGWYHDAGLSADQYPYWSRLFEDPNFAQKVADRWQELRRTTFSTEKLLADIDAAVAQLANGQEDLASLTPGNLSTPISRNYTRWTNNGYGLGVYAWPNCFFGQGDCPASPLPGRARPDDYGDYVFIMKWFVENRAAWIDSQFLPPLQYTPEPGIVANGTQVTITGPAGADIFYTLDGTDPRQPLIIEEEVPLIGANAAAQVIVPSNNSLMDQCDDGIRLADPTLCFANPDYEVGANGETWTDVTLGIGYDTEGEFTSLISTDVADLLSSKTSMYIRIPFEVDAQTDASAEALKLDVRYDDGFVAYSWLSSLKIPVELERANVPGSSPRFPISPVAFDGAASAAHPDEQAAVFETFEISTQYLREGTNYLVFQVLNDAATSTDFLFDVRLSAKTIRTEVSPSVLRYEGPITVDKNMQIIARGFNPLTEEWTGGVTLDYFIDSPNVAVSEINYHPFEPTEAELAMNPNWTADSFEFIELQNIGVKTANLVQTTFDAGITAVLGDVDLAPGDYGVVVRDLDAFQARYGTDVTVLGTFQGALDNAGERIRLLDGAGEVIADFEYDSNDLWPARADGAGGTLTLANPSFTDKAEYSKYYRWQGSTEFGGSPGAAGASPIGVVINEVLANSGDAVDFIELRNTTGQAINLGGWGLSDSTDNFAKYVLPAGTTIPANGYLVLDESDFNADGAENGFALSGNNGDDVWLTIPDGNGNVQSFVDDVHFGASFSNVTFGRYPNATSRLTPLSQLTMGLQNAYPAIGEVIISELNYSPSEPSRCSSGHLQPTRFWRSGVCGNH